MSNGIQDKYRVVVDALSDRMMADEFKRNRDREFLRSKDGLTQRLAISLREPEGERVAYVEVFPGFNYSEVEALAYKLQNKKPRPSFLTCSMNIGLLTPKNSLLEWPLESRTDTKVLSKTVIDTVNRYAFPFWEDFSTLDKLLARYEAGDRRVCTGDWSWRQAAAYAVAGRPEKAAEVLKAKLEKASPAGRSAIDAALEQLAQQTARR